MANKKLKFPCQICEKACKWGQKAIVCDGCKTWFHADCLGMASTTYYTLANTSEEWICCQCGLPNFHSSLFNLTLDSSSGSNDTSTCSSIGPPTMSSSPSKPTNSSRTVPKNTQIRVVNVNFRSIRCKKAELLVFLEMTDPDVVIGTETWLTRDDCSREFFPENYSVYRADRTGNTGYGGVLLAIKTNLNSHQLTTNSNCELVLATFSIGKKSQVLVGSCYRAPSSTQEYSKSITDTLCDLHQQHKDAIFLLGGDFNLPDINWADTSVNGYQNTLAINNAFLRTFDDLNLEQMVEFPTRHNPDSTLDLFLTNRPTLIQRCDPIPGLADHAAVLVTTKLQPGPRKPIRRQIHLWKKADMEEIRKHLQDYSTTFHSKYTTDTPVQDLWNDFANELKWIMDKLVPNKMSTTRYNQVWVNTQIKRLSRRKIKAYNKYKRTKKDKDWHRRVRLEKEMKRETRSAYNEYMTGILDPELGGNMKRLYGFIKSQKNDSNGVGPLRDQEGCIQTSPKAQAEILNAQFSSVFTNDNQPIPALNDCPQDSKMPDINIHQNGVNKLLRDIKAHKATGPDEIPARLLKEAANQIAPVLTTVITASYSQAAIPTDWKHANVVPIFKKGDRAAASNYRPVSLTSICCKLTEHIVQSQIMRHLDRHQILEDSQHGFRKLRSCETQLLLTLDDLQKSLDSNTQVDAILLDFSKAFDKVSHPRLLAKLESNGITGKTSSWIRSFLTGRDQKVILDGKVSESAPVTSGVPQGTVLGPLLFLIYINDLPGRAKTSTTRLFADDCLIYREIRKPSDAKALQDDLDAFQQWEKEWMMEFHPQKCQLLRITRKKTPIITPYTIHGHTLELAPTGKYLGVNIHHQLSWSPHINMTATKANRTRAFLQRNLRGAPHKIQKQCFETLIRPILEYSGIIWDNGSAEDSHKLEMVQRRYARFLTKDYGRTSSVTAMLNDIGWDTLDERRAKAKATMLYRIKHDLVDVPADDHLIRLTTRSRRGGEEFRVPYARTLSYKRSFFPDSIQIWNRLPSNVTAAESLATFKKRLSSHTVRS